MTYNLELLNISCFTKVYLKVSQASLFCFLCKVKIAASFVLFA